jgi:23S rRNA (guanine745-N1)-methyltransferase
MATLSAFSRVRVTPRARRAGSVALRPRLASRCVPRASAGDDEDASPPAAAAAPVRTTHSAFACPVCGGATRRAVYASGSASLRCDAGHASDVAKEGHVNLLAAKGGGRKRATGDTNEMVQARRRFLDAGHYAEAAEIIAEGVARYLAGRARGGAVDGAVDDPTGDENASEDDDDDVPNARRGEISSTPGTTDTEKTKKKSARAERLAANKRRDARVKADRRLASAKREALDRQDALNATLPLVVDFGCGEGYWLGVVAERVSAFNENEKKVSARFAGIDASPAAAKAAARRLSSRYGAEIAVGDAQRELDFADGSVDVALSVFAPRNVKELARVVKKNGTVIVASPGDAHLNELRALSGSPALRGMRVIDAAMGKRAKVLETFLRDDAFELVADVESVGVMRLCLDDVESLVNMGPSAFHQGNESNDDDSSDAVSAFGADDGDVVDVTRAFVIQTFRRK